MRLELADGRAVVAISVGEKGTYPVRVVAVGEAGHASMPTQGDNAVPLLAEMLAASGRACPTRSPSPVVDRMLRVLVGRRTTATTRRRSRPPQAMHPALEHLVPAVAGTRWRRRCSPARASAT